MSSILPPFVKKFVILFVCIYPLEIVGEQLQPIFWNSNNDIFRIDNTDHVFTAKIRDTVDIHCPLYPDTVTQDQAEYSVIYLVSKRGYDDCILDDDAKPIGQCLSPYKESIIKMSFREFTPRPGGVEFRPGEIYYFISTSTGSLNGLHNRMEGLCRKKNMKIKFDIVADPNRHNYFHNFDVSTTTSSKFPNDLTSTSSSSTIEESFNSAAASAMEVYLQKLPTDKPKFNIENSKFWRLLSNEERRHLMDNTVGSYEIDNRPQSNERMVVKPLFLSSTGNEVTPKGQTTNRQKVVLYEIHEAAEFDSQSIRSASSSGQSYSYSWLIFILISVFTKLWRWQA